MHDAVLAAIQPARDDQHEHRDLVKDGREDLLDSYVPVWDQNGCMVTSVGITACRAVVVDMLVADIYPNGDDFGIHYTTKSVMALQDLENRLWLHEELAQSF